MHLIRVVVGFDRDNIPDTELCVVEPRVIFATAPDNHDQSATGLERLPNIAHSGAMHHEEQRPEAREREVVGSAQVVRLYVCLEERDIAYAGTAGFLCGDRSSTETRCASSGSKKKTVRLWVSLARLEPILPDVAIRKLLATVRLAEVPRTLVGRQLNRRRKQLRAPSLQQ
ncbi:hypothetical protein SBBP2_730021 [Burkholderiales bacterium]|jgi:hypothetical protein|nr:hypothetical protein SBBP2_730021 [Burkholderiales bacterium]